MAIEYKPRIMDSLLKRKLAGKGAVVIEGAKWCGKTSTAEQISKSKLNVSDPSKIEQTKQLASLNPKLLLKGEKPRLIDEWQLIPQIWDAIRYESDHAQQPLGLFVLTGSSVPANMSQVHHTGTGRFAWLRMRPMSLWESEDSTGEISLENLFTNPQQIGGISSLKIEDLAFLTCRGGWPSAISMDKEIALDQAFDYIDAIKKRDISEVDGVSRDSVRTHRLLRSYARHQGASVSYAKIKDDLQANESDVFSEDTIVSYINALKQIFVIEDVQAWNPNLRSKTTIRTSDTRYFTDPSIATASMGLGPTDLINDLNTFGFIFETLCMRDLRVYAEALHGEVFHYRDKTDLECDAVIHLRNGSYGLIEIKLGGEKLINEGAVTLKKLANKIDTDRMKHPSFLMILTGVGDYAFRREDGVYVVPIGCLKD